MKRVGVIKKYNGKYCIIESENILVDFSCKDISFNKELNIGDKVQFRIEKKQEYLFIARNITLI